MMDSTIKHLCTVLTGLTLACSILVPNVGGGPAGAAVAATPANSTDAKAKLAGVRARIADLTSRLAKDLKARDVLNAELRDAELDVTAKRLTLDALRAEQLVSNRHTAELRAEQARNERALDAERASLAAQVRAAYQMGSQEEIKLLLNQGDPAGAGRMLAYYGYFARQRSAQIGEIRGRVQHGDEVIAQIEAENAHLQTLLSSAQHEMQNLDNARSERARSAAALAQRVSGSNQELDQLKRQEQALQSLVEDLARVMQDFPVDSQQSFGDLKGKLSWPVPGHLAARYQEAHANVASSGARWNGVMIETARAAKVRAPYFGRVVYADWLQGLGLLMIIGHTGGYMTLYGHAEVLYKSVGEWVSPGDVIAGMAEGGAAPQLYFEIREGRKTVDPKNWLKGKP